GGLNAAYLLDLYDRYRADPRAVDPQTRAFFEAAGPPDGGEGSSQVAQSPGQGAGEARRPPSPEPAAWGAANVGLVAGAVALAMAIRAYGHRAARLDPLGREPPGDPELLPETYGLREADLA